MKRLQLSRSDCENLERVENVLAESPETSLVKRDNKSYACKVCNKEFSKKSLLKNHFLTHTAEKSFVCEFCSLTFASRSQLNHHYRIHTKPYSCEICNKSYSQSGSLRYHLLGHTGERPFACELCTWAFKTKDLLQRHLLTHTLEKPYACVVCSKAYRKRDSLKEHYLTHTGEKPYSCEICYKAFSKRSNLWDHRNTHSEAKVHVCELCKKSFAAAWELRKHSRLHNGEEEVHQCELCKQKFRRRHHLRDHYFIHTGEKPYTCEVCNKAFYNRKSLWNHRNSHSLIKSHVCELCKKSFVKAWELRKHVRSHTRERKKHECELCKKTFTRRQHLKEHLPLHTGKPLNCTLCEKTFFNERSLKQHAHTHNNKMKESYVCDLCNEVFARSRDLKRHRSSLHGRKPFVCKVSGKKLSRKTSLNDHLLTSTRKKRTSLSGNSADALAGEQETQQKLHSCKTCDKAFFYADNLKLHAISHIGEKYYVCNLCDKAFSRYGEFRRHNFFHSGKMPRVNAVCNKIQMVNLKDHRISKTVSYNPSDNCETESSDRRNDKIQTNTSTKINAATSAHNPEIELVDKNGKSYLLCHTAKNTNLSVVPEENTNIKRSHKTISKRKTHVCTVCEKVFFKDSHLKRHALTHVVKKTYVCDLCNEVFFRLKDLRQHHSLLHTGLKPFICKVCGKRLSLKSSLRNHLIAHTRKELATPSENSAEALVGEEKIQQKNHSCRICKKAFFYAVNLKLHIISHIGTKFYVCNQCDTVFTRYKELKKHRLFHRGKKLHVSNLSKISPATVNKAHRNNHTIKNTHSDNLKTEIAENEITQQNVKVHAITIITTASSENVLLDKNITDPNGKECALNHITNNNDSVDNKENKKMKETVDGNTSQQKMHFCDVCNKAYKFKYRLKDHATVHTGERRHVCDLCDKKFAKKHHLQRHRIMHTGEKSYLCAVCKKSFSRSDHLRKHRAFNCKQNLNVCAVPKEVNSYTEDRQHSFQFTMGNPNNFTACNDRISITGQPYKPLDNNCKPNVTALFNKGVSGPHNLRRYNFHHEIDNPIICEIDNRDFSRLGYPNQHHIHFGESSRIGSCDMRLSNSDHMYRPLNNNCKTNVTTLFNRGVSGPDYFKRTRFQQTIANPSVCNNELSRPAHLNQHIVPFRASNNNGLLDAPAVSANNVGISSLLNWGHSFLSNFRPYTVPIPQRPAEIPISAPNLQSSNQIWRPF